MSRNDTLYMKIPASWAGDLGREGTPLGNGKTGVLIQGGVGEEVLIFNRNDVWREWEYQELPKLDGALQRMRDLIDQGDYFHANDVVFERLQEEGYTCQVGIPLMLGALRIKFETEDMFSHYRRNLHMDKAECEISYAQKCKNVLRKCFVSRDDDTFYYEYNANEETNITIRFNLYDDETSHFKEICDELLPNAVIKYENNRIDFSVKTEKSEYAIRICVYGAEVAAQEDCLKLCGKNFRIAVRCYSGENCALLMKTPDDFVYEEKIKPHLIQHRKLYHSADIRLSQGKKRSNEELLDEAYEDKASPELIEKMWRFGRYLFICGTCKDGLPFPLMGLWHSRYYPGWAQHVANENVEMIYWHAEVGGLAELVRPLIDYYYSGMDIFRDNAEKLYGCKGIFIGVYTSPVNLHLSTLVPVILNFTGVAGWLSQHFYKYFRMTGDRRLLDEKIFPFMLAAADFYLDYIAYDKEGKIVYYPCVSPENTPENLRIPEAMHRGHWNPVTKNAVIEIAIVKELFTNLITLINETREHMEYLPVLQKVLTDLPPYLINRDGAIKEWATEELEDNYNHRHVSHIYPLFPGEEITKENNPRMYAAIERAVDLRKLGAQSGWSLAHMASIYAALGRSERAIECLDTLLKGCTLRNLFTLHNDYRNMGIALTWKEPPVQMDANMGIVNAVQKMMLDEKNGCLYLLPSLPERFVKGSVPKLWFTKGKISMKWDKCKKIFEAKLVFKTEGQIRVKWPKNLNKADISATGGTWSAENEYVDFSGKKGDMLIITCK